MGCSGRCENNRQQKTIIDFWIWPHLFEPLVVSSNAYERVEQCVLWPSTEEAPLIAAIWEDALR